uniref:HVA22-like protein n=2 Tax=Rhizophora mucronata TaxID=61149 RepID=A0A2P2L232_RHIMU
MIGSFLTRGLMMVFGYAYPAYECYKTVEKNKPEIEKLRFWCQYWILVAVLTVCERIGDAFISWVPMYSEAKLAFFIYLWYPKTMGTTYVYDSFFRPYVAKHENEIDRNLLELRTRAGDMAVLYWQRAASYGQTRVFDILQYVAAQSTPRQRPAQAQQGARARQAPSTPKRQLSAGSNHQPATTQPETEEPLSPLSSLSSSQNPLEVSEEVDPSRVPELDLPPVALNAPKAAATSKTSSQVTKNEAEAMQIEALPSSSANENANPQPKEMVMEETGPVTRAKSKRTRPGGGQKNA